jgi:hypothetical protein
LLHVVPGARFQVDRQARTTSCEQARLDTVVPREPEELLATVADEARMPAQLGACVAELDVDTRVLACPSGRQIDRDDAYALPLRIGPDDLEDP